MLTLFDHISRANFRPYCYKDHKRKTNWIATIQYRIQALFRVPERSIELLYDYK